MYSNHSPRCSVVVDEYLMTTSLVAEGVLGAEGPAGGEVDGGAQPNVRVTIIHRRLNTRKRCFI